MVTRNRMVIRYKMNFKREGSRYIGENFRFEFAMTDPGRGYTA